MMKFFRNMSITRKMILICLNICLLPLIIGFMFIYNRYVTTKGTKSLELLINKGFSNIENVRKMAFYNKITTIQQSCTDKKPQYL